MRLRPFYLRRLAIILVIALLGCDSDGPVEPPPEQPPVWSEITNLPSSITLYGLWAPRADLVIGVGSKGRIWQWDGQRWSQRVSGSAEDLFAIAGSTGGSVMAVGNDGTVLEQSLGVFVPRDAGTSEDLRGLWRSESGEFVAVGAYGVVIRGSGSSWAFDPTPTSATLFSVWGSSDSDIFAVGVNGTILHYDGGEWSPMSSGTTAILSAVSGTSASDVYAVGSTGTVLHYNGTGWTSMASGTTELLQSVCADWGPAAAGANGIVLRMKDGAWQRERISGAPWLYAIARAGDHAWVVGSHALYRHTGAGWSNENRGTVPVLRAVISSPAVGLVAAGEDGVVLLGGPKAWRVEDAGALQRLNAAWATASGDVFVAGTNRIYRYAPTGWTVENESIVEYYDLGGDEDRIFAVGSDGRIRERVGTTWPVVLNTVGPELRAVTVANGSGFIAGAGGTVYELDNGSWQTLQTHVSTGLWDIIPLGGATWRAITVGEDGASYALSVADDEWISIPGAPAQTLRALARGPGDVIHALGTSGVVLSFGGDRWNLVPAPTSRTFLSAWSRDGTLFAAGGSTAAGGMLFRFGPPNP